MTRLDEIRERMNMQVPADRRWMEQHAEADIDWLIGQVENASCAERDRTTKEVKELRKGNRYAADTICELTERAEKAEAKVKELEGELVTAKDDFCREEGEHTQTLVALNNAKEELDETQEAYERIAKERNTLRDECKRLREGLEEISEISPGSRAITSREMRDIANKALSQPTPKKEPCPPGDAPSSDKMIDNPGEGLRLWREWFKVNCAYWEGVDDVEGALARIRSGSDQCEGDCDKCNPQEPSDAIAAIVKDGE